MSNCNAKNVGTRGGTYESGKIMQNRDVERVAMNDFRLNYCAINVSKCTGKQDVFLNLL